MSDKPLYLSASANKMKSSQKAEPALHRQHDGWTLQELIDAGMSVTAVCLDCHRHQALDLPALRDRFGANAPAMEWDLRPRMKCAICGGRRVTLTYSPDTSPKDLKEMIGSRTCRKGSLLLFPTQAEQRSLPPARGASERKAPSSSH
ncbi:hypothetical protein [Mesorhizobium sp. WSM3860]|uniref:hypothetical protein n=1 Tax=Mesorhizobium sp. WSM3860 TaxID=2029403 RepID=UPI0015964ABF|nr:hypothetical protein [Mesorhizobium sp. WSM3860]